MKDGGTTLIGKISKITQDLPIDVPLVTFYYTGHTSSGHDYNRTITYTYSGSTYQTRSSSYYGICAWAGTIGRIYQTFFKLDGYHKPPLRYLFIFDCNKGDSLIPGRFDESSKLWIEPQFNDIVIPYKVIAAKNPRIKIGEKNFIEYIID